MAHSMRLNENLGVIVLRYRGSVDFNEIRKALDDVVRLPGFKAGLCLVADFRDNSTPLTAAEVSALADYAKRTDADWGVTKWAFIAAKDVTFGLARMFSALTANYQVTTNVFRDARAADDWLGLGLGIDMKDILASTPE